MDYYKMFWINAQGDAHSTRNKGRLSQRRIGWFVWVLDSGKRVAESHRQADEFGTDHFQLYENWDKFSTEKSLKTESYEK